MTSSLMLDQSLCQLSWFNLTEAFSVCFPGDIEPPSMCHALVSLKYFPYICGLFLAVILAVAIGLGGEYH